MRCNKAEKLILKAFDDRLNLADSDALAKHLEGCTHCQNLKNEYRDILGALKSPDFPQPKPYFWERLQPRLQERPSLRWGPLWKQWGMRAIPCSLAVILIFAVTALVFLPTPQEELSQSGMLLRNQTSLVESLPVLAEDVDNPGMALIFTSLDEQTGMRR